MRTTLMAARFLAIDPAFKFAEWMTTREAGEVLGLKPESVRCIARGGLPRMLQNGRGYCLVNRTDVQALVEARAPAQSTVALASTSGASVGRAGGTP